MEDHPEKEPYDAPPAIRKIGSIVEMTQGATGTTTDFTAEQDSGIIP